MNSTTLSANWRKLQQSLKEKDSQQKPNTWLESKSLKRKATINETSDSKRLNVSRKNPKTMEISSVKIRQRSKSLAEKIGASTGSSNLRPSTSHSHLKQDLQAEENEGVSSSAFAGKYIALDCEMVGVGLDPDRHHQLARLSLVNYHGDQLYDTYVAPVLPITDYRTAVSGIRPRNMKTARPFDEVLADVSTFLKGRILVGHQLKSDLAVLAIQHPAMDLRDTCRLQKFRQLSEGRTPSLKKLAKIVLGLDIQAAEHSSLEDARAAMLLYRAERDAFEVEHTRRQSQKPKISSSEPGSSKPKPRKRSKRKR